MEFKTTPNCTSGVYTVTSDPSTNASNPPSGTNQSVSTTGGSLTVAAGLADLSITKTDSPDPIAASGGTLTYTIGVSNAGPNDASAVKVTDTIPAGTSFVSATGTNWTCNNASGTVTCNRTGGNLAAAAAPNITLTVTVAATTAGTTISNTATVSSPNDNTPANNSATAITNVNSAPTAGSQSVTTAEDTAKIITLTSSDFDNQSQMFSIVTGPTQGTLGAIGTPTCTPTGAGTGSGTGPNNCTATVTYTPAADYNGPDSFTFKTNDGMVDSADATVSITVTPVNDAPVAVDDSASTSEDTAVAKDVITNDTDVDNTNAQLSVKPGSLVPTNGTATLDPDGRTIHFTPSPDLNDGNVGPGGFKVTYKATDGSLDSNVATLTISVSAVNDAPVADDETISTPEDTAVDTPVAFLLAGDTDIDSGTLTVTAVSGASGGTAVLDDNGTAGDKTDDFVRFTPTANLCGLGAGEYDYTVSDGALTDTGHVTVNITCVNDAPVADDETISTPEDTAVDTPVAFLLAGDTDIDSGTLTVTAVSGASGGTAVLDDNGTAGDKTDDFVRFTPTANLCGLGAGEYDYTVSDGALTDTGHVTVNITCVNDAPVADDETISTPEDTAVDTPVAFLLAGDTDIDSGTLTVTAVSGASGGTAVLDDNGTAGDKTDDFVRFTPTANLCGLGAGEYDYTVSDGALTDTGHVTVNITCVNDAPVADDETISTPEDTAVDTPVAFLLAGDTDIDSGTLTVTAVSGASGGTAVLDDNGTAGDKTDDFVRFTPTANLCGLGAGEYDYTVSDGALTDTGHVTVNITCVDDAPVADDETISTPEDTAVDTPVAFLLAGDTDIDSGTLTVTAVSGASGGTAVLDDNGTAGDKTDDFVRFTPTANLCGLGAGEYDYTVSDGALTDTGHVTVNITCVNDAPVAVDDAATTSEDTLVATDVIANDTDVDNTNAQLSIKVGSLTATNGTATIAGDGRSINFTPDADKNNGNVGPGGFTVTYRATDGALDSNLATLTISVTAVNDAPVADDETISTLEDTAVDTSVATLLAGDTDIDSATLTVTAVSGATGGAAVLHDNGTTADKTDDYVTFTPAADLCGLAAGSYVYTVSDGALTDTGHVTVNITCVNDAPVANDDAATTAEDTAVATDVITNDTDVDNTNGQLSIKPGSLTATNGTASIDPDGRTIHFLPDADLNNGNVDGDGFTVTYKATDGTLDSNLATLTISVTAVNDAPVVAADQASVTVNEGQTAGNTGTWSDVDDGDIVTLSASVGIVTKNANGTWSWSYATTDGPDDGQTVTITATDIAGATDDAQFSLTVNNVKPSISLTGDATADEGSTHTYGFTVTDPGQDTHTITTGCGANGAKVTDSDTYAPGTGLGSFQCFFADGPATTNVTATVTDSDGASDTDNQVVVVTVSNVAPTVELSGDDSALEGSTHTYTYTVSDPGDDPNPLITESCGANGTRTDTLAVNSFTCTFPDGPASSTVTVTADDGDPSNNIGSDSILVAVANVAPTVELSGDDSALEGSTHTYTYTVSDPGDDPNPLITESCGANGTRTDTLAVNSFTCTFPDGPASSTVTVTADDGDPSNNIGSDSILVAVANVAPTVELSGDDSAHEGSTHTYTYTVSDPGDDPNPLITESCGANGTRTDTLAVNSFTCTFPDGPASSTVTVTADDGDPSNNIGSDSIRSRSRTWRRRWSCLVMTAARGLDAHLHLHGQRSGR